VLAPYKLRSNKMNFDKGKFYLGVLCLKKHDYNDTGKTLRRNSNRHCPLCQKAYKKENRAMLSIKEKEYRIKNKDKVKEWSIRYREKYNDKIKKYREKYQKDNRERLLANKKLFYANNKDKRRRYLYNNRDRILKVSQAYRKNNKQKVDEMNKVCGANYRAKKKNATVSYSSKNAIRIIYRTASILSKMIGREMQVDHIVPLTNKLVCGLHHEGNLQIISKERNLRKSNKFEPIIIDY
jgi:hypothetical protein